MRRLSVSSCATPTSSGLSPAPAPSTARRAKGEERARWRSGWLRRPRARRLWREEHVPLGRCRCRLLVARGQSRASTPVQVRWSWHAHAGAGWCVWGGNEACEAFFACEMKRQRQRAETDREREREDACWRLAYRCGGRRNNGEGTGRKKVTYWTYFVMVYLPTMRGGVVGRAMARGEGVERTTARCPQPEAVSSLQGPGR